MIEVVYKEEKKKPTGNEAFFRIPKNIRQIGEVDEDYKIYIEDYAYQYLDRMADESPGGKIALLLGQTNWAKGTTYLFVKSAFAIKGAEIDANHIPLSEEIWEQASEEIEKHFSGQEVIGWYFTMPECPLEPTEVMYRTHINYFAGNNRIFFLKEPVDREELLFRYDDGAMCRQRGYYLYYERNEAMQNFLIEENHNRPMEQGAVPDRAVKDFRKIIAGKKEEEPTKEPEKKNSYFMYASTAAALLLALVLGINYLNDYQNLKDTPETVEKVVSQVRVGAQDVTPAAVSRQAQTEDAAAELTVKETELPRETEPAKETELPKETEPAKKSEISKAAKPSAAAESFQDREDSEKTEDPEVSSQSERHEQTGTKKEEASGQETQPLSGEAEETSGEVRSYTIHTGDTLTSISKAVYGNISMIDDICRLNGITEDTIIYAGEKILLP